MEKRTSVTVTETEHPPIILQSFFYSSAHPPPVNHPLLDMSAAPFSRVQPGSNNCVCLLYGMVGGWRVPEWLSPQIVKEAHGKFTPWAKPQAFSIVSADLSFLDPFKNVIITFCFVVFFLVFL